MYNLTHNQILKHMFINILAYFNWYNLIECNCLLIVIKQQEDVCELGINMKWLKWQFYANFIQNKIKDWKFFSELEQVQWINLNYLDILSKICSSTPIKCFLKVSDLNYPDNPHYVHLTLRIPVFYICHENKPHNPLKKV